MNGHGVASCWHMVCLFKACYVDGCLLLVFGITVSCESPACMCTYADVVWVMCACQVQESSDFCPGSGKGWEGAEGTLACSCTAAKLPHPRTCYPGESPLSLSPGGSHARNASAPVLKLWVRAELLDLEPLPVAAVRTVCVCVCVCVCTHAHRLHVSTLQSQLGRPRQGVVWTCMLRCAEGTPACRGCQGPGWASF